MIRYKKVLVIGIVCFFSCNSNNKIKEQFKNDSAKFNIIYSPRIKIGSDNFFEIKNYSSSFDDRNTENRHIIGYVFIEDTIIDNGSIFDMIDENKISYGEFSVIDTIIKIPKKLLYNKKGNYKMTIAIQDVIIGDIIQIDSSLYEENEGLKIDLIDSRSYHDIFIE